MKLKFNISKWAIKIGAIVSSAVLLLNTGILSDYKAEAYASCTFDSGCSCKACEQDPRTWNQGAYNDLGINTWSDYNVCGQINIGDAGCYFMSAATLMAMSGVFGDSFCPMQFFKYGNDNNMCNSGGMVGGAWDCLANIPGHENQFIAAPPISKDTLATSVGIDGDGYAEGSHESMYKLAVELASRGYYVIIRMNSSVGMHYTAVSDVIQSSNGLGQALIVAEGGSTGDDGTSLGGDTDKIGAYVPYDSSDSSDEYFNYTKYGCSIDLVRAFVCESSPFTGKVNATGDSGGTSSNPNAPTMVGLSEFLAEEYFIDMNKLQEPALELFGRVEFRESTGLEGVAELENWVDSIDNKHEEATHRYVRAAFMFVGILIMVYSVILFIAYQFDKVNNFVEIQLLGILTFNRLAVSPDDKQSNYANVDSNGTKYLKLKDICIVCVVGISIGVLLVSGKVFLLVMSLINWIDDFFRNWGM